VGREDLAGEHPIGDAGQIVGFILFLLIWLGDSFHFRFSTILAESIPLYVRQKKDPKMAPVVLMLDRQVRKCAEKIKCSKTILPGLRQSRPGFLSQFQASRSIATVPHP